LFEHFDENNYNWWLSRGGGVAAVRTPVLNIEHQRGLHIPVQLGKDISSFSEGK
jgi:hypothetical protein